MKSNYHWDRDGNTQHQQCPACKSYFPVSAALSAAVEIDMICPSCHHAFRPEGRADPGRGTSKATSGE